MEYEIKFFSLLRLRDDRRGIFVIHHSVDDSAFRNGTFLLFGLSGRGVVLRRSSLPFSASSHGRREELVGQVSKLIKTEKLHLVKHAKTENVRKNHLQN